MILVIGCIMGCSLMIVCKNRCDNVRNHDSTLKQQENNLNRIKSYSHTTKNNTIEKNSDLKNPYMQSIHTNSGEGIKQNDIDNNVQEMNDHVIAQEYELNQIDLKRLTNGEIKPNEFKTNNGNNEDINDGI